jgi:hypothetical protein
LAVDADTNGSIEKRRKWNTGVLFRPTVTVEALLGDRDWLVGKLPGNCVYVVPGFVTLPETVTPDDKPPGPVEAGTDDSRRLVKFWTVLPDGPLGMTS